MTEKHKYIVRTSQGEYRSDRIANLKAWIKERPSITSATIHKLKTNGDYVTSAIARFIGYGGWHNIG